MKLQSFVEIFISKALILPLLDWITKETWKLHQPLWLEMVMALWMPDHWSHANNGAEQKRNAKRLFIRLNYPASITWAYWARNESLNTFWIYWSRTSPMMSTRPTNMTPDYHIITEQSSCTHFCEEKKQRWHTLFNSLLLKQFKYHVQKKIKYILSFFIQKQQEFVSFLLFFDLSKSISQLKHC